MIKMKKLKFEDVRDQIIEALQERSDAIGIKEPLILENGFFNDPLRGKIENAPIIGGDYWIPMVVLIGENSGRVYLFSLKELLKDKDETNS